jgi:hypothetical protein
LEEPKPYDHQDVPKTSYDAISEFSEGVYAYQFHTLYAKPISMHTRGGLESYLYALDIGGTQGPWGLKDSEDRPVIMAMHEAFAIDMIDDAKQTHYMVTAGKNPIEGVQAWVGYGTHHRSNQVPDYFDGAVFFRIENTLYGGHDEANPKRLKAAASGQLFVEINDGNPNNNQGQLTFWLIKEKCQKG